MAHDLLHFPETHCVFVALLVADRYGVLYVTHALPVLSVCPAHESDEQNDMYQVEVQLDAAPPLRRVVDAALLSDPCPKPAPAEQARCEQERARELDRRVAADAELRGRLGPDFLVLTGRGTSVEPTRCVAAYEYAAVMDPDRPSVLLRSYLHEAKVRRASVANNAVTVVTKVRLLLPTMLPDVAGNSVICERIHCFLRL